MGEPFPHDMIAKRVDDQSTSNLDEPITVTVESLPRKDYQEYLQKLDSVNYKKDETIKEFIHEVKSH